MARIFVGLSGGVDSGTSAALLQEQGHDVVGVFIKIWQPEFIECTWREDRLDAMRVAAHLGIPYREIDLSAEYKAEVVDTMVRDYQRGVTPNPDVSCNEKIKFGHFARWAFENGADMIATGHYARVGRRGTDETGPASLLRGLDMSKDQSYFLYRIAQDDLVRTVFPLGELQKAHVREHARRLRLPVAEKPDSQGLCFVGDVSMRDFLARYVTLRTGAVLDPDGMTIGEHDGAALYTIGQRHGFVIHQPSGHRASGRAEESVPHFVIGISVRDNTITVSPDRILGARDHVVLRDAHWIGEVPTFPLAVSAQSRYREEPFKIEVLREGDMLVARFDTPRVVSAGQSLVLYDGEHCLGGGVIEG